MKNVAELIAKVGDNHSSELYNYSLQWKKTLNKKRHYFKILNFFKDVTVS